MKEPLVNPEYSTVNEVSPLEERLGTKSLLPICDGVLETKRLRLRRLDLSDAPSIAKQISDWAVAKQTISIPLPYKPEYAVSWIKRSSKGWRKGKHFCVAIEAKADGGLIGSVSLRRRGLLRRRTGVLGYWIGRDHWGKGLAAEAVEALLAAVLANLDLKQIEARVFADNFASRRVLEKNEFLALSTKAHNLSDRGGRREIVFYHRKVQ